MTEYFPAWRGHPQDFDSYKDAEKSRSQHGSSDAQMLLCQPDYATLSLRIDPATVGIEQRDDSTWLTVDSANFPGEACNFSRQGRFGALSLCKSRPRCKGRKIPKFPDPARLPGLSLEDGLDSRSGALSTICRVRLQESWSASYNT